MSMSRRENIQWRLSVGRDGVCESFKGLLLELHVKLCPSSWLNIILHVFFIVSPQLPHLLKLDFQIVPNRVGSCHLSVPALFLDQTAPYSKPMDHLLSWRHLLSTSPPGVYIPNHSTAIYLVSILKGHDCLLVPWNVHESLIVERIRSEHLIETFTSCT